MTETTFTAERRQQIRAYHRQRVGRGGAVLCQGHPRSTLWPCDMINLLDALEAADVESAALRDRLALAEATTARLAAALEHIEAYWNGSEARDAMADALYHIGEVADEATSDPTAARVLAEWRALRRVAETARDFIAWEASAPPIHADRKTLDDWMGGSSARNEAYLDALDAYDALRAAKE